MASSSTQLPVGRDAAFELQWRLPGPGSFWNLAPRRGDTADWSLYKEGLTLHWRLFRDGYTMTSSRRGRTLYRLARRATDEFRDRVGDHAPLHRADDTGRWWRKP